ncbi:hypothetical protein IV487_01800 [Enterococcus saccharolyticus]|uniref:hypothetical protein n=1 Tax=Enterococcus saccharolyticus TaxID=41997 RepID=UPI001E539E6B|nr:hypothetical protein [Enterococcus saccharolyticus]MCD5001197.1 hypothetical protein [Enterococcus saccharolyticus]
MPNNRHRRVARLRRQLDYKKRTDAERALAMFREAAAKSLELAKGIIGTIVEEIKRGKLNE